MLGSALEEQEKSDKIWDSPEITALREQQENDFGLWGSYKFTMPKEQGKWEEVTTNSPKILANKIMSLLASSWLQLFIGIEEEKEPGRKRISNTERLANGAIWLADRAASRVPSGKKIQSALSTYAVLKGGTAKSVLWYEVDGKPKCDIKTYDPTYCQWIEGEEDLLWFCHRKYVSEAFIKRTYKKQIADGFNYGTGNRILTYTFWDDQEWKVSINNNYVDEGKHGLGYVPVNVRPCGTAPYIYSEKYNEDTMKHSWTSCFANNRDIYDLESKMLSIESSKALESGKIKITGDWDSTQGDMAAGIEKLGYTAGGRTEIVLWDTSKGQKFGGMVQPPGNEVVDQFLNRIRGMDIIGSIDPIAFGQMTRSGSGALAAELRAAALEFINPFRECLQDDFIWIAEETVRQFKNGDFEKVEVDGRDKKKDRFHIKISPKDVEEKWFDCNLVADRLRDEIQELGAAIQKVSYGLSSRRTAMLKHNIVEDPDKEQDIMDEEVAALDPVFRYDKMAKYFADQGDERMAQYYMALSAITIENTVKRAVMAELIPPGMPEGEKPPIQTPQMETGQIAAEGGAF